MILYAINYQIGKSIFFNDFLTFRLRTSKGSYPLTTFTENFITGFPKSASKIAVNKMSLESLPKK